MTLARELGQARIAQRGRYSSGFRERAFMLSRDAAAVDQLPARACNAIACLEKSIEAVTSSSSHAGLLSMAHLPAAERLDAPHSVAVPR